MLKISILLTFTSISLAAKAGVDDELRRYYKCHGQLVREIPNKETDSLIKQIQSGSKTGTEACMELLNLANFVGNTIVQDQLVDKRKSVLKTMNDFHRNWFENYDIRVYTSRCTPGTMDVHDGGVMSYYLTKALFSQDYEFKNLTTANTVLEGVRSSKFPQGKQLMDNKSRERKLIAGIPKVDGDGKALEQALRFDGLNMPVNQLGELIGIKEKPAYTIRPYNKSGLYLSDAQDSTGINLFQNPGAGAVTTPTYFINNLGTRSDSDGALHVPRRWSRSLLKDVLCRDVPVVRTTDAIAYVDQTGESPLSFREGVSCMQCHSTMDQMARVARGIKIFNSAKSCSLDEGHPVLTVNDYGVTTSTPNSEEFSSDWIDNRDQSFYKRPKTGVFYFRTADGDLINKDVEGLDQLGDVLAETNDLYYCASKRYLQFFTNIDTPLFDPGDIKSPKLTSKENEYVALVKKLGKELKQHQDPKKIIQEIISSDFYINPLNEVSK